MEGFDFKNPNYAPVFAARAERLLWLRDKPERVSAVWTYYRDHPADFINDWGMTIDPRNVSKGVPSTVPFLLFPKQREWVGWLMERWAAQEPGITEKSRDLGLSWLAVAVACTVCIFNDGVGIGFGSRKEEYVDKLGHPKSLFYKARFFMELLPVEFRREWNRREHGPHMRLTFPWSGSTITGEAGDGIGRGDRASIYFVDESAHLERPHLVEASLAATTDCRQDISSVRGMDNPFAIKRHGGEIPVFTFHWRDDPRKDDAWYQKQCARLDAVTVAQEIDLNYSASVTGVVIPSEWVQAAIGAHLRLGITPTGRRMGALDIADEGPDKNGLILGRGVLITHAEERSGKGSDTDETTAWAFLMCDDAGVQQLRYDSDGLGAGTRGAARNLNAVRKRSIQYVPFRGSGAVAYPGEVIPSALPFDFDEEEDDVHVRKNEDYFANAKSQGWWSLRVRFQRTFMAINGTLTDYDPDDLVFLDPDCPNLTTLARELSQPTWGLNTAGKVIINKKPDGSKSPNLADGAMIYFAPMEDDGMLGLLLPNSLQG